MRKVTLVKENRMFEGWVKKFTHLSEETKTPMTFSVYFPPSYGNLKTPVLIFLSGLTCTDDNFMTKSFAQHAAAEFGIALIAPDTSPRGLNLPEEHTSYDFGEGAGFYVDATTPHYSKHYRMYSYINSELELVLENIENSEFFSNLDLKRKSIFGHSMGGLGSIVSALKNPGKYKSVSAFAPISNPCNCPWGIKAFTGYFGANNFELWKAFDPSELVKTYKTKPQEGKLNILIDQGLKDEFFHKKQLLPEVFKASSELNKENIALELRYQAEYDHSYFFVASFISDHIQFHALHLSQY